jgi:hypothetical protein
MCQRLEPELSKYKMNDKVSSLKVGKNVWVLMFEHKNYSDQYIHLGESTPLPSSYKFNDKVSSLIVMPNRHIASVGAWLEGSKLSYYPASETCGGASYPHLMYNDDATNVRVWGGRGDPCLTRVTIYEHSDFKGKSETCTSGGKPNYDIGKDLLGKAPSLKIEIIGKCPVRTQ